MLSRRVPSLRESRRCMSTSLPEPDDWTNVPPSIEQLMQRKLYKNPQHPLSTLISRVEQFFDKDAHRFSDVKVPGEKFQLF